jgi:probable rRNA maturation factor
VGCQRGGMQPPTRRVSVDFANKAEGLSVAIVRKAIATVLDGESVGAAEFCVTFLSSQKMRALNRRLFRNDRATDVIAFGLPHPGLVVGDIYICPSAARRAARELKESAQAELVRLVVHGTLHALGYEHPSGDTRCRSDMWCLQEDYLEKISRGPA